MNCIVKFLFSFFICIFIFFLIFKYIAFKIPNIRATVWFFLKKLFPIFFSCWKTYLFPFIFLHKGLNFQYSFRNVLNFLQVSVTLRGYWKQLLSLLLFIQSADPMFHLSQFVLMTLIYRSINIMKDRITICHRFFQTFLIFEKKWFKRFCDNSIFYSMNFECITWW